MKGCKASKHVGIIAFVEIYLEDFISISSIELIGKPVKLELSKNKVTFKGRGTQISIFLN